MQKTGETTRDMWHKTDWAKVRDDPASIALPRDEWIHSFDVEKNAEEVFDEVFKKYVPAEEDEAAAWAPSPARVL